MATKLGRKVIPAGHDASDFKYMGRPATKQDDFDGDVGIADLACVNQFGEANNAKYYHGGVVQSQKTNSWFVYLEWGRMKAVRSWNGSFGGGDFQFVECSDETDARAFFAKQLRSKNTKRLERKTVAGVEVWAGRKGKDGYIVQQLATREKGLPDAYTIKDSTGVAGTSKPKKVIKKASTSFQPQVVAFAQDLVGGTRLYTRALSQASGVTPTMAAIQQVRDDLIPAALKRIKAMDSNLKASATDDERVAKQVKDVGLRDITKMVAALVPRPIGRKGQTEADFVLSANNILSLQNDLDAFESTLQGEDFETVPSSEVNPDQMLNARLVWLDTKTSREARWVAENFIRMTHNRHGYLRGTPTIRNIFAVYRDDRDAAFMRAMQTVAKQRQGRISLKANLQPSRLVDGKALDKETASLYEEANVIFAIHGTRPVNMAPIVGTNFRLPKSLPGAQITGANFGHGVYFATDWRKSYGYTGRGYWGNGGGGVANRGCMMFLCDMLMGDAYRAPSTGSWGKPPDGKDSVFGMGNDRQARHRLENDEHVIFDPAYQRIRYVVEFDWLT